MTIPGVSTTLLVIAAVPCIVRGADEAPDDCIIIASHESSAFALARPMPFSVTYRNDSAESWSLYQPDECTCVLIRAVSDNPYYGRVGFNLGKSGFIRSRLPDGSEIVASTVERPPRIAIETGDNYSFQVDINSLPRSALREGRWDFSVTDRMEDLTSASVPFVIVVTRDSIDRCLEVMVDESLSRYTRAWHGGYLARVRPDLPFDFSGRDRTPEQLAEVRANNADALEEFDTWWAEHRDSEEVEEALERINEQAGVLDEYRALRDELEAAAGNESEEQTREN